MYRNGIDMRVLVNGRACKEYNHNGTVFIEARHGTSYTVRLKNDNGHRVMAILSVDGLDVITGKPAEESNKGYIVDAYSSTEIKGYRVSDSDSASFVFSSKGKSYATKTTGTTRNNGVLGVRVFREKEAPKPPAEKIVHHHHHYPTWVHPWNPWNSGGYVYPSHTTITTAGGPQYVAGNSTTTGMINTTYSSNSSVGCYGVSSAPGAQGMGGQAIGATTTRAINAFDTPVSYKSFDAGTTWGKKQTDKVKKEYFEKGALVTELVLYYATREALFKMGVDLEDEPRIGESPLPQPFGGTYCQPPKGWRG